MLNVFDAGVVNVEAARYVVVVFFCCVVCVRGKTDCVLVCFWLDVRCATFFAVVFDARDCIVLFLAVRADVVSGRDCVPD